MALTQARAFGAHAGRRYGSFAGKAVEAHPVDRLTQARAFGAHAGARYGSFEGRGGAGSHPVGRLTQLRAFGAHAGARYGSFAGRGATEPPTGGGGGTSFVLPPNWRELLRERRIEEDDQIGRA